MTIFARQEMATTVESLLERPQDATARHLFGVFHELFPEEIVSARKKRITGALVEVSVCPNANKVDLKTLTTVAPRMKTLNSAFSLIQMTIDLISTPAKL